MASGIVWVSGPAVTRSAMRLNRAGQTTSSTPVAAARSIRRSPSSRCTWMTLPDNHIRLRRTANA